MAKAFRSTGMHGVRRRALTGTSAATMAASSHVRVMYACMQAKAVHTSVFPALSTTDLTSSG